MYRQINGHLGKQDDDVFSHRTACPLRWRCFMPQRKRVKRKPQIQKTFYYPSMDVLNPNSAALTNQFNKPNPDYKLATVNNLSIEQGLTPTKSYVRI